ncbi:hypothetical protein GTK07_15905 [Muricauda sp. 40Bstr401]|uniref:Uncharacterized protein n=2 Tax=Flagellimonas sediminis TaxID=2696468 RepID=A0A6I5KV34_9FLAO|nr:hypothetical protein [Allomuricauda sediminis]
MKSRDSQYVHNLTLDEVQGMIIIAKKDGQVDTLHNPAPEEGELDLVGPSPDNRMILLTVPTGDGGRAWVYHIGKTELHEIEGGFGLGEIGWRNKGGIVLHQGCVMMTHCKKLESKNVDSPWIMELVEDLGKTE